MRKCDDMRKNQKIRLFIDMDGTLAEFKKVSTLEELYEEGYFKNLKPQINVVEATRKINAERKDIEVYILSAVLEDSQYALKEKQLWLDKDLPEIDDAHRVFTICGMDKNEFIHGGISKLDFLLDDYTKNLVAWEKEETAIKLINNINHTKGTWRSWKVDHLQDPKMLTTSICSIIDDTVLDINKGKSLEMLFNRALQVKTDRMNNNIKNHKLIENIR